MAKDTDWSDSAEGDHARQAEAMAWGYRGPSASYAEWWAEGHETRLEQERCVNCANPLCRSCGGCWCEGNRCHELGG